MSPKEQAQHLSDALQTTQARILETERTLYTTKGNREELKRLKRVARALDRDLKALVKTIPAPVQYALPFFTEDGAPRVAPSELGQKLSEDDRGDHPSLLSADGNPTPQGLVP
jgi:hypothetical protein